MEKEIKVTPFYYDHVLGKPYEVIVQVGGRISGKSWNSEIEDIQKLGTKSDYKLLIIEDLDKGLSKGYYAGLKHKIELFEQEQAYKLTTSPPSIKNTINGNEVLFSAYATEQQRKAVKAIDQVTAIRVEEGEWLRYDDFTSLLQQLRGGAQEDRQLQILMNPVDPDCFVNEMLIIPKPDKVIECFPGTKRPKVFEKNITTTFTYNDETVTVDIKVLVVLSTHHDNPYITLTQRASIEQMKLTDKDKWLQLAEARFIRPSGTYFNEFDVNVHVIEAFPIPKHWHRFTTKDYGLDMLAEYWLTIDTRGNAYVYKELYEPDLIISEAARRIKEVNGKDKITVKYAPPDLWNRRQETGRSATDIFRENGEVHIKSSNDRVDGWLALKEWLKVYETRDEQTGETMQDTRLKFFENCTNIIRTLPKLQKAEHDANDVETKKNHEWTHGPDAIRGFAIMRQRSSDKVVKTVRDDFAEVDSGSNYLGGEVDSSYLGG